MAISGFGNTTSNLRLSKPAIRKEEEVETKKVQKKDEEKAANAQPKVVETGKTLKPITGDSVGSFLAGKGIKINRPVQPEQPEQGNIEPKSSFNFDTFEDYVYYLNKVGFRKGDVISIHMGKDEKGNGIYQHYKVIDNNNTIRPLSDYNYDNIEDFTKALKAGVFKEGDNVSVKHGGHVYDYFVNENGNLEMIYVYDNKNSKGQFIGEA